MFMPAQCLIFELVTHWPPSSGGGQSYIVFYFTQGQLKFYNSYPQYIVKEVNNLDFGLLLSNPSKFIPILNNGHC